MQWFPKSSVLRHRAVGQQASLLEMQQLSLTSLEVSSLPPLPGNGGDSTWDSIPKDRGDLSNGQKCHWPKHASLLLRPLVPEGKCDWSALVWKPRQQRNERWLKEGRAVWLFFLPASWNASLRKSSQQSKAGQRWMTNLLRGISLLQGNAMCRGSQWPGQPVLSASWLAGLVFYMLPEIH